MRQNTVGNIEFTRDDERLSLRYTPRFRRKAAVILLLMTVLAVALLIYPIREFSRGNVGALPPALFLLIIATVAAAAALAGWSHLGLYAWRCVVFDRRAGTCSLPRWFFPPVVLPLRHIKRVVLKRARTEAGTYRQVDPVGLGTMHNTDRDSILLEITDSRTKFQRLWGRLGLTQGAEAVAEQIAEFLGCKLERRPARYFR